jgi:hypothetical protein
MRQVFTFLLATTAAFCAGTVSIAAPAKTVAKKHAPVQQSLTLKSPNGKYSLILTKPLKTDLGKIWRKVDLQDKNGKITNIGDESGAGDGYEPAEDNLWSPDGAFAIMYHDTLNGSNWMQDDRLFVDCENGITTTFQTKNGTVSNLSNCQPEWIKGKPHSLQIIDDKTNKNMEAQPAKL